jgi:charged multivesicular body protein 3
VYARELYSIKKQQSRLYKSKAQLDSVAMQIDESFGMLKLQQNMAKSSLIMREVNSLVKLPELTGTMRELERELVKSGIINEMVGDALDTMDEVDIEEEEEIDEEINKIVSQYTTEKFDKVNALPQTQIEEREAEPLQEDDDHVLNEMRERLKALQN